jgi:cyanophycinase
LQPRISELAGPLAMIGGRFESDNEPLFTALKSHSQGRIVVLAMASGYPEEVGAELVEDFINYGFEAELLPLFWDNRHTAAFDSALVDKISDYGSVFFSGGDQSRITGTLIQDGRETPVLQSIRRAHAAGGLVAGTSAGAAIMSGPMIASGTSLNALAEGLCEDPDDLDGFRLGTGLGFFPWGLVDQHFLQRGRIGRLLAAAREFNQQIAFGIDENSAMLVRGSEATVIGETGAMFVDMRQAKFNSGGYDISDVRISYLDDGDRFDLAGCRPLPAADKKHLRVTRASYRRPAPVRRHAFSSYALHDLMLRLVEGDPAHYRHDSVLAYDEDSERQICLELSRAPQRSRALRAVRDGEIRYSAIGFDLRIRSCAMPQAQRPLDTATVLPPDPVPGARLVLLGNSPLDWDPAYLDDLRKELREPVGIVAAASNTPRKTAGKYLDWLQRLGIRGEIIPVSQSNIERASKDRALLKRISSMGSLLFTGGDQRRLTETLLHCADATPVLHTIVSAYEKGVPLIGVAGAASAFAARMIVDGDSRAAFRYGSSEDAGFSGVIMERGIGLTSFGLIDQNFMSRHRLGRLLVACAAQRSHYGFGLCEESGLVIVGGERRLQALGRTGVIVAAMEPGRVRLRPPDFKADGIRLNFVEPGGSFHLDSMPVDAADDTGAGMALLERAIADLVKDYNANLSPGTTRIDASVLKSAFIGSELAV